jgi:hypothetical protein
MSDPESWFFFSFVSSAAVAGDTAAELRSAREDVRQLLWPLLSACRSRSVDLKLQLKGLLVSPILLGFQPINLSNLFKLNYLIVAL